MNQKDDASEWYNRHRPTLFKHVVGQDEAVASLKRMLESGVPHALLFSGPSGAGKTTLARIMRAKMNCGDSDFVDMNAASARGIDTVREIESQYRLRPWSGDCRVWLIDECHRLTQDSQSAMLKMLEDPPPHAYFFLATTDPQKLLKTILTRVTEIKVRSLSPEGIKEVLVRVGENYGVPLPDALLDVIVKVSDGSARKAVNLFQQTAGLGEEEAVKFVLDQDAAEVSESLARILTDPKASRGQKWDRVREFLKTTTQDPEEIRWGILGYARAILLNSPDGKRADFCYRLICAFETNLYDSKHAGLAARCYEFLGK